MVCWYVGVVVVTEDDSTEEVMEKLRNGDILQENGFDIYKLPGTLEDVMEQIKNKETIDGLEQHQTASSSEPEKGDGILAN